MFYDAECVVSAIAKFLVHLFGEGRGVIKWEREGGRYRGAGNGNA